MLYMPAFLIYVLIREKVSVRNWVILALTILILWTLFFVIKNNYQQAFFAGGEGINIAINDFSGQTDKVKALFTFEGIWMFVKGFIGKLYYACSSSYLLVGISITLCMVLIYRGFKMKSRPERQITDSLAFLLFLTANTFIMMAINSVYMLNYYGRFDFLIYGRYYEFTISPLIFVALIFLTKYSGQKKILIKYAGFVMTVYAVAALLINYIMDYERPAFQLFLQLSGNCRCLFAAWI